MIGTAVIGGGLSGLVRAWSLVQRGEEVILLESSPRAGGLVRTERRDGFLLELGPNTVRPTPELWRLVEMLGLAGEAILADPRLPRYIDFGGRLHPLPMSPPALLGSGLLSAKGKLRLLAEPFIGRGRGQESVRDFFARRFGSEVAERLVEPFVAGIFAGDASRLSLQECFPALARWERERGSLAAGGFAALRQRDRGRRAPRGLLSFREGLETLPRAIGERLGERLRFDTEVRQISPFSGSWRIETTRGSVEAQRLVLAAPAADAARLVAPFDPEVSGALAEVPCPPLAVLHLAWAESAFPSPLRGFGHLVVPQRERRILGTVWSSSLFPGRAPEGRTLLTVFLGGARDPEAASLSDGELAGIAARDVTAALGASGDPRIVATTRYPRALPQYDFGHAGRSRALAEAESRWAGLSFLGNYRGGVSVGDVVRSALL
jgi:protoporphyrinogen/coproporphyrinogen III oxidase